MMLDKQTLFSDGQSLAINNGSSALSTNSLDLGVSGTPGIGGTLFSDVGVSDVDVLVQISEVAAGAGSSLTVALVSGTGVDGNGQINANETVLSQTAAIAMATLKAGYQFRLGGTLPRGNTARYLALKYSVSGANMTGGKITSGIVLDKQTTTGM